MTAQQILEVAKPVIAFVGWSLLLVVGVLLCKWDPKRNGDAKTRS